MSSYLSVDRIENGVAACETDGRVMRMIPVSVLPEGVAEGDVLYERGGRYVLDRTETAKRREENARLMKMLRELRDDASETPKAPEEK
ncbi:MAG: DUF3006 domain-containing protein [Oscillospiraceae bacterium]|jgi:hypothetical protein|nr:DUF3006 domain-containing protein [Oscillospiraceae bacterium]